MIRRGKRRTIDGVWLTARNYVSHLLSRRPRDWRPLLAVYYLTYACDFRCPYCSDGANKPYHALRSKVLRAPQVLELLRRLRRRCDYLVLTGGEPLKHPDFDEVMSGLPRLGFDGVVLTTNGHEVGPHLPLIMRAVRYLVFSVDTLDRVRADAHYGLGPGTLDQILENLARAVALARRQRGCEIIISAVATPENLEGLLPVYEMARRRGLRFALCPQLCGVKAPPSLAGEAAYRGTYDYLIEEKKRGHGVNGTVEYLEHMRDLKKFDCRPSTMVAVAPTGEVFYPCLEIGHQAGNLLEHAGLDEIRIDAERRFGPEPSCDTRCHSACALSFALLFGRPITVADEIYRQAKGWALGRTRPVV